MIASPLDIMGFLGGTTVSRLYNLYFSDGEREREREIRTTSIVGVYMQNKRTVEENELCDSIYAMRCDAMPLTHYTDVLFSLFLFL